MKRINLTQHDGKPEQGCFEPENKEQVKELLTFEALPTKAEIRDRAVSLAIIAKESGAEEAMIGGAPYLMADLETELRRFGVTPVYAFSRREAIEDPNTGEKISVFKHIGFIKI